MCRTNLPLMHKLHLFNLTQHRCIAIQIVAFMVWPFSNNGRRKTAQNSIEVDAETKESTRKTEENLGGRNKEGHERKKPK